MSTQERLREVRENLLAEGAVVARSDGRRRELFPIAIGPEDGASLRNWVRKEVALQTFETGLAFGMSTLFICEGLLDNGPGGRHVAIDPYEFRGWHDQTTHAGVGLEILENAGVRDLVDFYEEESQIVLPRLLAEGRRFDLAFIDGNHRFEGVFLDLVYGGRLVKEGGVVFLDDMQLPAVSRAVAFCIANLDWVVEEEGEEPDNHRWMVLRTASSDVFLRPFTHFTDF